MYGFELKQEAQPVATVDRFELYVPSGYDSVELIESVKSTASPFTDETPDSEVFPVPNTEEKEKEIDEDYKALKNDKFYRLLQAKMSSGSTIPTATRKRTGSNAPKIAVRQFFQNLLTGTKKGGGKSSRTSVKSGSKR
eukprot:CAMPEP_0167743506 /NCGR_PEP_ID=MMETSP0110_2-20121227/2053_1 /TAXON_ID=629695 /ORGANISM="Gymnochlora sp., Strain CCMP2014" /LENGTH=137 /DNA_ID=CAMNT_0007627883 /DNA_START=739 /DNA_END=1152 /DNA_ORIENTATION=-